MTAPEDGKPRPCARRISVGIAQGIALIGLVIAAATVRVVLAGEREIKDSTAALRAGDPHAAALHARRAAGWYAPGAPHVRVAYDRLIALATAAEGLGNTEVALFAWNGVRTAAIETRWLVTPHEEDLARANQAIARISSKAPAPLGAPQEPPAVLERRYLEGLARDEAPRTGWIAALFGSFVLWTAGAAWTSRRGLTPSGRVVWASAAPGLAAAALGIGVWLIALWRA